MSIQTFNFEVIPILPESLSRLDELANNLWYSWDAPTRDLFSRLDKDLWIQVGHNPKLFLRNIDQERLHKAADDPVFLKAYHQVTTNYDTYNQVHHRRDGGAQLDQEDLIAYFCAEYGFHESLPVYSGGLGILAGDHCKTASDLRLPFVGIGLFYPCGYFSQRIDAEGNQIATHNVLEPHHLPLHPVVDETGAEVRVDVPIADKTVFVKAWQVKAGHITLYLLDTHVPENGPDEAAITYQLYGGDQHTRIQQEIVLGIGGVRLLRRLGLAPTIWHINEGHAAFLILERLHEQIHQDHPFEDALESVAANTVFTTHTPVPAGHDHFPQDLMIHYLGRFAENDLKLSEERFLGLGCWPQDPPDFNMTTLAVVGSRQMNGVSRIHGQMSSEICAKFWPEITPDENPVRYVTNGVHVQSVLAWEWVELFDQFLGGEWFNHLCDTKFWQRVEDIPDQLFWKVKQTIKSKMLEVVRSALTSQHLRNQVSQSHLDRILKYVDPDDPGILTIGFARRFATYKRATLLFNDLAWLRTLLNDVKRPIVFIFAGKAHPADIPGQDFIRAIHQLSHEHEFVGKILLVQGYDLGLSRRLVSGVDVWLNNPVYPLEASGTSGMKAAINAALNLSVLDGWWAEGYDGENGWSIKPSPHSHEAHLRDREDARTLYEILQDEIVPLYYYRSKYGYSPGWVKKAKRAMATILPRFNTVRMLNDYLEGFYIPASQQRKKFIAEQQINAGKLANWKTKIRAAWSGVYIHPIALPETQLSYGEAITLQISVNLNHLDPEDIVVELLLSRKIYCPDTFTATQDNEAYPKNPCQGNAMPVMTYQFTAEGPIPNSQDYKYSLTLQPEWCGGLVYCIRAFPFHALLANAHEMGMMKWI